MTRRAVTAGFHTSQLVLYAIKQVCDIHKFSYKYFVTREDKLSRFFYSWHYNQPLSFYVDHVVNHIVSNGDHYLVLSGNEVSCSR
jgi:hypothetical protein